MALSPVQDQEKIAMVENRIRIARLIIGRSSIKNENATVREISLIFLMKDVLIALCWNSLSVCMIETTPIPKVRREMVHFATV